MIPVGAVISAGEVVFRAIKFSTFATSPMYRYLLHHSHLPFLVYTLRLIVLPVADTGFDWTACLGDTCH
jgi:hypothetical protein